MMHPPVPFPGLVPPEPPPEPEPERLFTPVRIGSLTLPNRIVMAAMTTGFASRAGRPSRRLIAWYEARAAGGAGLIIVESTLVDVPRQLWPGLQASPSAGLRVRPLPRLRLDRDEAIPRFRALAEAIHRAGARAAIQLHYPPVPDVAALPAEAIAGVVEAFGAAAARARRAGFDAIEIQASHRSLLAQLLSPATNRRQDRYGRGAAGRLRALVDVVRAARRQTDDRLPVLVKFSADEYRPNGITPQLARDIARALVAAGAAALEVIAGSMDSEGSIRLSAGVGEATQAHLAAEVRAAVGVPVLAAGRIVSGETAERVVRDGQGDLVSLGRALLADPAWPAKVRAGIDSEIIPCIGCMACFTPGPDGATGCPVNGEAGREFLPPLPAPASPRRVAILGASLPGLELARVAAMRGHEVTIATAGLPLGGLLGLRAGVPGNAEYGRAFLYFAERLHELGAGITDQPDPGADVTVDCRPRPEVRPAWARGRAVLLAGQLLGKDLHELYGIGRRVAVVGPGALAAETALFLAGWGRRPTVIVPGTEAEPFPDVHPMHAARLRERLDGYHVPLVTGTRVLEWIYDEERRSKLRVVRDGREEILEPFHSAVSAAGWPQERVQIAQVKAGQPQERVQVAQVKAGQPQERVQAAGLRTPASRLTPRAAGLAADPSRRRPQPRAGAENEGFVPWPARARLPPLPATVPDGATISLGDTPYVEPLRDLVAYAHLLGRRV
jgi:2,4-dienoyl-CoA reductase-like NADH-dependent reductase (Old Yellow Enzyme family)